MSARDRLVDELRAHALVVGDVVLTSGRTAAYYVDAKRAVLRPAGFAALAELVAERARERVHSAPRELVDDADDILLAPFAWAAPHTTSTWARRGVPALLAVFVYGFCLSFLARYVKGVA